MNWNDLTTIEDAARFRIKLPDIIKRVRRYLSGDYWQGMDAWAGTPIPRGAKNRWFIIKELERSFVPEPLIEETTERHVNGLVGKEPSTEFVLKRPLENDEDPTPEEMTLLSEVNAALDEYWDSHRLQELTEKFTTDLVGQGRATMRVLLPSGLLKFDESGAPIIETTDWLEALDKIYLEVPDIEYSMVVLDRQTQKKSSLFFYSENVVQSNVRNGQMQPRNRVEVSFLDDDGKTVVRILEEETGLIENGEISHDCAGELYIDEATRPPLISDSVMRQQNALNVINTMMLYNGNLAGFRERNFINLKPPTREIDDPNAPNGKRNVPSDFGVGPGAANFWAGIPYDDGSGKKMMATGSVIITDPVSPAPLIEAAERFQTNIYRKVSQLHVKISGDATASAVSRVQARSDFLESLQKTRPKVEAVLRSRLLCVFALACFLANDTARLEAIKSQLRVRVDCHLNAGPMSPDERDAVLRLYEGGLISLETAQIMLNIEDVAGEVLKLRKEQGGDNLTVMQKADLLVKLTSAGASIESAAAVAGFDEDATKLLTQTDYLPRGENVLPADATLGQASPPTSPRYKLGDAVQATVNHMPGMTDMIGSIAIVREGVPPYYGIRFDGMAGIHKWMAEDELKPAKKEVLT